MRGRRCTNSPKSLKESTGCSSLVWIKTFSKMHQKKNYLQKCVKTNICLAINSITKNSAFPSAPLLTIYFLARSMTKILLSHMHQNLRQLSGWTPATSIIHQISKMSILNNSISSLPCLDRVQNVQTMRDLREVVVQSSLNHGVVLKVKLINTKKFVGVCPAV